MKKLSILLLLSVLVISACSFDGGAADGVYTNDEYGFSFEYPEHWQARERDEESMIFAANFDYMDGLAELPTNTELEGTLSYYVVQNPDGLSLKDFYQTAYEECMAEEVAEDNVFGNWCDKKDFDKWTLLDIDGHTAYESGWTGIPESGEMQKRLFVGLDEKDVFLVLSAWKTGQTDAESIQTTAEDTFGSLSLE